MKKIILTDHVIILLCVILSNLIFILDLFVLLNVAIGILYVSVILLSLKTTQRQYPYYAAAIASFFVILGFFIHFHDQEPIQGLIDRILLLGMVWITAWLGYHIKKRGEVLAHNTAIINSTSDGILTTTLDGYIHTWNKGAEKIYGYTQEEMIGSSIHALVPDHRLREITQVYKDLRRGGAIQQFETARRRKDGAIIYVALTISPMRNTSGMVTGVAIIARDTTLSVLANEHLRGLKNDLEIEKNKFENVLNLEEGLNTIFHLDKLIDFVVQKTVLILEAKRCSIMLFDENTQELCIKGHVGLDDAIVEQSRVKLGEPIAGVIAQEDQPVLVTNIELDRRFRRSNRASYQCKSFIGAPIKLEGRLIGIMSVSEKDSEQADVFTELDLKILRMITSHVAIAVESAKLSKELNYLTMTDPLTNIYNYRYFIKSLDHEIKRQKRYHSPLCLLFIDIDNFKSFNMDLGFAQGDELLKQIGRLLNEQLRDVDIACRYAADEFAVILPSTDAQRANEIAHRIQRKINDLPLAKPITASIGIAQYNDDMSRYDLILKADMALLSSKKEGKNHICIH